MDEQDRPLSEAVERPRPEPSYDNSNEYLARTDQIFQASFDNQVVLQNVVKDMAAGLPATKSELSDKTDECASLTTALANDKAQLTAVTAEAKTVRDFATKNLFKHQEIEEMEERLVDTQQKLIQANVMSFALESENMSLCVEMDRMRNWKGNMAEDGKGPNNKVSVIKRKIGQLTKSVEDIKRSGEGRK